MCFKIRTTFDKEYLCYFRSASIEMLVKNFLNKKKIRRLHSTFLRIIVKVHSWNNKVESLASFLLFKQMSRVESKETEQNSICRKNKYCSKIPLKVRVVCVPFLFMFILVHWFRWLHVTKLTTIGSTVFSRLMRTSDEKSVVVIHKANNITAT